MRHKRLLTFILVLFFIVLYGISRAGEKWQTIGLMEGLPNKYIKDMKSDGEYIYIATANGLAIYNGRTGKITVIRQQDGLADNYISALDVDAADVWLATDKGLSRYNKRTGKILTYTKKDGLVDDEVSAVLVDEDYVWAGTKYWGISRFDKSINRWQTFSVIHGLVDNSINTFAIDSGYIWIGTKNGLSYYDKITGLIGGYDTTQGLTSGNIRSIRVGSSYIWLGTVNGLIRFDKYEEAFKTYTTTDGLADDYIQSLNVDGQYLWIGTFSGVTRYDLANDKWFTYTIKDGLIENSVSAVEVDGNYIWFGTDGSGISRFDKEIPQARISPFSHYASKGSISLAGTAFDYEGIDGYTVEYKNDAMKSYLSTDIKLESAKNVMNGKLAEWDVSKLLNISYDVRLTVRDKKGRVNTAVSTFVVDTKAPQLTLDPLPEAVNSSALFLKGSYLDDNIREVFITVNGKNREKAGLDQITKKYNKEVQLESGVNNIEITASDIANQATAIRASVVFDREKPVITLESFPPKASQAEVTFSGSVADSGIQRIVLNPGNEEIPFTKTEENNYTFTKKVSLQPGFNKFEISAYDFVGNKASVDAAVELTSSLPIISINKSRSKVAAEDYEVSGTWADDSIDSIILDPYNMKAAIDPNNKTFSLKVKLNKGENVITATIVDKDRNKNFDVHTVLYSTEVSKFDLVRIPPYTIQNYLKLEGVYDEQNLKSIIVRPGGINLAVDAKNNTFSGEVKLNPGANSFEVEMQDRFGQKTSKKFTVISDPSPPEIILDRMPETVYAPEINIAGSYQEDHLDRITLTPGDIPLKTDPEKRKFSASLKIKEGKNDLVITALDKAGNKKSVPLSVTYIAAAIAQGESADPEYVRQLKQEIERLKNLLKAGGQAVYAGAGEREFRLPSASGLALVPYGRLKAPTFLEISKKYLGGILHLDLLNRYNSINTVKPDNLVLLPTRSYIRDYMNIRENRIREILDIIALSYRYSFASFGDFRKRLGLYLQNRNYISRADSAGFQNTNRIKGGDFSIHLNDNAASQSPYTIRVIFSRDFMNLNIKTPGAKISRSGE